MTDLQKVLGEGWRRDRGTWGGMLMGAALGWQQASVLPAEGTMGTRLCRTECTAPRGFLLFTAGPTADF